MKVGERGKPHKAPSGFPRSPTPPSPLSAFPSSLGKGEEKTHRWLLQSLLSVAEANKKNKRPAMQLKTLLNEVHPVKGFVYGEPKRIEDDSVPNGWRIEVGLRARKGSRGLCSSCGNAGPGYDRLPERGFDFVPLWGVAVTLLYALRRVDCPACGVKVERVPWCDPASKSPMTTAFKVFLSRWAKLLSWRQVAVSFGVSWDSVYRAVAEVVAWGLEHRDLSGIDALGIDEVAHAKGHKYLTLVYQLNSGCRRLLYVGRGRSLRSLLGFFRMLKKRRSTMPRLSSTSVRTCGRRT